MRPQHILTLAFIILEIHPGAALGARWADASTGLTGSFAGARTVVVDRDGATMYVVSSGDAVFKSTDGGSTWKALGGIAGALALGIDAALPANLYAGTLHGVRKSSDGGEIWMSAGLDGKPVRVITVDPITPSTLYAGAGNHVYKSTDGAATWAALDLEVSSGPEIGAIVLDPFTPSIVYVVSGGAALYKSTDGGESWTIANPGPFSSCSPSLRLIPQPYTQFDSGAVSPGVRTVGRRGPLGVLRSLSRRSLLIRRIPELYTPPYPDQI
jgi:photosystem II stability/assembly factor-like uncharacterized protein